MRIELVNATWISPDQWFWECFTCECAFGPLSDKATAGEQAALHAKEEHAEEWSGPE